MVQTSSLVVAVLMMFVVLGLGEGRVAGFIDYGAAVGDDTVSAQEEPSDFDAELAEELQLLKERTARLELLLVLRPGARSINNQLPPQHTEWCADADKYYCLNGGRCFVHQDIGIKSCVCGPGFTGERCQMRDTRTVNVQTWTRLLASSASSESSSRALRDTYHWSLKIVEFDIGIISKEWAIELVAEGFVNNDPVIIIEDVQGVRSPKWSQRGPTSKAIHFTFDGAVEEAKQFGRQYAKDHPTYNLFTNNCQDFVQALRRHLGAGPTP
jgi:hypothetical protein